MYFIPDDVDASLSNWRDAFLSAVDDHIPKRKTRNGRDHTWIDKNILSLIREKAQKSGSNIDA